MAISGTQRGSVAAVHSRLSGMWGVAAIVAARLPRHARLAAGAAGARRNRKWRSRTQAFEPPPWRWPRSTRCVRPSTRLQKDVGDLKGSVEQRSDHDKTLQSRVAALEERVAALPSSVTTTTPANVSSAKPKGPEAKGNEPKAAEKVEPKAVEKAETKAVEKPQAKAPAKGAAQKAGSTPASGSKTSIETGSITQPQIVFGEAVVTRAEELYAVQLGHGDLARRTAHALGPAGRAERLHARRLAAALRGTVQGWALPPAGRSPDQRRRRPRHLRRAARPAAVLQHHRLRRRTAVADCMPALVRIEAQNVPSMQAEGTRLAAEASAL